jgi:hypothetical protein
MLGAHARGKAYRENAPGAPEIAHVNDHDKRTDSNIDRMVVVVSVDVVVIVDDLVVVSVDVDVDANDLGSGSGP